MDAFKDGILSGVEYQQARWIGGEITPEIVVLHDTASRLTKGNVAAYLRDNTAKVSVQFVVERDGSVVQQVPINRRANHAGTSNWHGRKGCNGFSVGIEIVNVGRMTRGSNNKALAWFGKTFDIAEFAIQEVTTAQHGSGLWMPYPEAQITAVIELLQSLFNGCDSLKDITTHWFISPGRKVDTNPLFPLEHIKALVLGRSDPEDERVDAIADVAVPGSLVQIVAHGDTLNMRRWPSFNPNIIAAIPDRVIVPVLRLGEFDGRAWICVQYAGQEGWIVADYADPITYQEAAQ